MPGNQNVSLFGGGLVLSVREPVDDGQLWEVRHPRISMVARADRAEAIQAAIQQVVECADCGESHGLTCTSCNQCEDCCRCWECEGGAGPHITTNDRCEHCERCEYHCSCHHCPSCACVTDNYCSSCDNCHGCCECDPDEDEVDQSIFVRRQLMFYTACKHKGHKRVPSKRHISVEIEVAKTTQDIHPIKMAASKWRCSIVEDGSLPNTGFEINTSPANGDKFAEQITDLCNALDQADATVTASCGLHVHVSAKDYRFFELRKLIILYHHIEPTLFEMQPKSRRDNRYCQRCGSEYLYYLEPGKKCKESIVKSVYKKNDRSVKYSKMDKYHASRYQALNIHSWFHRGTIEFRLGAGTVRADKIIPWGTLLASILDYANEKTERYIYKAIADNTSRNLLMAIAPTQEVKDYICKRINAFS